MKTTDNTVKIYEIMGIIYPYTHTFIHESHLSLLSQLGPHWPTPEGRKAEWAWAPRQ